MLQMILNMLRTSGMECCEPNLNNTISANMLHVFLFTACRRFLYFGFYIFRSMGRLYICREGSSRAALSIEAYIWISRLLSASVRQGWIMPI
jgi:hypothetical protein